MLLDESRHDMIKTSTSIMSSRSALDRGLKPTPAGPTVLKPLVRENKQQP
jgi:hypothetical protein